MRALIVALCIGAAVPAFGAAPDASDPLPNAPPASSALKQLKAARLDKLFADLWAVQTPREAKAIEREIVREWLRSGDDDTDEVMLQAMIAMASAKFGAALGYLNAIVTARPDYVEGWNKRATLYFYLRDYEHSLADIDRVLALEPRHFGALAGLGMIKVNQGDKQGALDAFERAFAVDPALDNARTAIEKLKAEIGKGI